MCRSGRMAMWFQSKFAADTTSFKVTVVRCSIFLKDTAFDAGSFCR